MAYCSMKLMMTCREMKSPDFICNLYNPFFQILVSCWGNEEAQSRSNNVLNRPWRQEKVFGAKRNSGGDFKEGEKQLKHSVPNL